MLWKIWRRILPKRRPNCWNWGMPMLISISHRVVHHSEWQYRPKHGASGLFRGGATTTSENHKRASQPFDTRLHVTFAFILGESPTLWGHSYFYEWRLIFCHSLLCCGLLSLPLLFYTNCPFLKNLNERGSNFFGLKGMNLGWQPNHTLWRDQVGHNSVGTWILGKRQGER